MTVVFCVWLLENNFRRVLADGSLFISRCCNFFSAKEVVDTVNFVYYCCVTSSNLVLLYGGWSNSSVVRVRIFYLVVIVYEWL